MKSQVYSNVCNCIDRTNINHLFNWGGGGGVNLDVADWLEVQ